MSARRGAARWAAGPSPEVPRLGGVAWRSSLGGGTRPASMKAGEYDRFLSESRALLKEKAEAVLSLPDGAAASLRACVRFPGPSHPLLADSPGALAFLRSFLALRHSPSLVAWARERALDDDAVDRCR